MSPSINPKTGKKSYRRINWGVVDESLRFTPGPKFYEASPEERARLIFPESWDMSHAAALAASLEAEKAALEAELAACCRDCQNYLYGDVWLLEQVAMKTGLKSDLAAVFDGDLEAAGDVLTLAMHPYLAWNSFSNVAAWQRIAKTPSARALTPAAIYEIAKSVTERHRRDLVWLRTSRLSQDDLYCLETASGPAEDPQASKWGDSQDLPSSSRAQAVVYSLESHAPAYYKTFDGSVPASKMLDVMLNDLKQAGLKNLIWVSDRGFESTGHLEPLLWRGQPVIMGVRPSQKQVAAAINDLGTFGSHLKSMKRDPKTKKYYKQVDLDYNIGTKDQMAKASNYLKLHIYYDAITSKHQINNLDIFINNQKEYIDSLIAPKGQRPYEDIIAPDKFIFYKITFDPKTRAPIAYKLNEDLVTRFKMDISFSSIITNKINFDAMKVYSLYALLDEQTKIFQKWNSKIISNERKNWFEDGRIGHNFILFISIILSSYVRHIWESTDLYNQFSCPTDILDEMRSIRYIEAANGEKTITPFSGSQLAICQAFGFEAPPSCQPTCRQPT
ncbi:MAG: hypothetical protein LBE49_03180 [Deltaproteobacteria bacterium]|jgi:hypothetical protein|nr:hypothetical protein [Deltaproteobacteria bacterium]